MKKIIIVSVAVFLLLAVVLGIFVIPFYRLPAPITLWDKKQVEKEYMGRYPESSSPPQWADRDGEKGFSFYFGKYNGYYIVCDTYNITSVWGETVGDYQFEYGSRSIFALKDGKTFKLTELYERGELSDQDLAKIYEYYLETKTF